MSGAAKDRALDELAAAGTVQPGVSLAPLTLNIVCFRFTRTGMTAERLNELNGEIVVELQERGIAAPSTTRLGAALAIRVNLTNHRSRYSDLELLRDAVVEIGEALAAT